MAKTLSALQERLQRLEIELESKNAEIDELRKDDLDQNEKIRDLERKITKCNEEKKELMKQVEEQRKHIDQCLQKIDGLSKRVSTLENNPALYVAEAASLVQHAICKEVLPVTYGNDRPGTATIKELLDYINKRIKLPSNDLGEKDDLEKAKNRWKEICKVFNWTEWDYKVWDRYRLPDEVQAIITLKKERLPHAHPKPIELRKAMQYIPELQVGEHKRKRIRKFLGNLQDQLRSCQIYIEDIVELAHAHYTVMDSHTM